MLTVPATIQTLFKTDGIRKNFRVHFPNGENADLTNADIVQESVTFTESVCSRNTFQFGLSERSEIDFECVGVQNIYGMTIECGIEIDTSSLSAAQISAIQADPGDGVLVLESASDIGFGYYRVPYGVFIVENCPRSHGAMSHRKVTAYSKSVAAANNVLPNFFTKVLPFPYVDVTPAVIRSILGTNELTEAAITPSVTSSIQRFYNSAGDWVNIKITDVTTYKFSPALRTDLYKLNFDCDLAEYERFGQCIAEMLDNAGIDILCNSSGTQVFNTTEEALRCFAPHWFAPSIKAVFSKFENGQAWYDYTTAFCLTFENGVYMPALKRNNYGISTQTSASDPNITEYFVSDVPYYIDGSPTPLNLEVEIIHGGSSTRSNIPFTPTAAFPTQPSFTFDLDSAYSYTQDSSSLKIHIAPTLNVENAISMPYQGWTRTGYSYANAFSWEQTLDGMYELSAMCGRFDRTGSFVGTRLDQSDPVSIQSSEYSDLWWDDYSIEPIGTVQYSFQDGSQTTIYQFSSDRSIYDMTGNYFLQKMDNTGETADQTIAKIITMLDNDFVPYVSTVDYSPSDIEMIGLPYLEAGDYLEIDDANSGTVETYMLRRTLSGIQTLTDTISSVGGEVIKGD